MKCNLCVLTTIGRRESNQDRACAVTTSLGGISAVLLAIADGMGGMRDGDRAAEIAIATVRRYADEVFPRSSTDMASLERLLDGMFQTANQAVYAFAQLSSEPGRSGTTLVVCLAFNNQFVVAHAGDSRCYYINQREIRQLTEDHSKVQDLVRQGSMTAEAARRSPYRNQLINSLGEEGEIRVDICSEGDWGVSTHEPFLLLLSSDGLHGELPDEEIFGWVHGTKTLEDAARSLLSAAIQGGSTDNVTVAAVECGVLRRKGPKRRLPLLPDVLLAQPQDSNGERWQARSFRRERIRSRLLVVICCAVFGLLLAAAYLLWQLKKENGQHNQVAAEAAPRILPSMNCRLSEGRLEMTWPSQVGRSDGAIYEAQVAADEAFAGNLLVNVEGLSKPQWTGVLPETAGSVVYARFASADENGRLQYSAICRVQPFENMERRETVK